MIDENKEEREAELARPLLAGQASLTSVLGEIQRSNQVMSTHHCP